jgi:hypothetical protein
VAFVAAAKAFPTKAEVDRVPGGKQSAPFSTSDHVAPNRARHEKPRQLVGRGLAGFFLQLEDGS